MESAGSRARAGPGTGPPTSAALAARSRNGTKAISWLVALLIAAALPALAGCGVLGSAPSALSPGPATVESVRPGPPGPGSGGVLRMPGYSPLTLDPALSRDVTTSTYLLQVFSGLVSLDDHLEIVPEIASSWTVEDGGRTYTFHLRPEARFHDGREVTAEDFKYSLERALDPQLRSPVAATYLGDIVGATERLRGQAPDVSGIKVVDSRTLQIAIDAPKPYFLAKLTYPTAYVVDRGNVRQGPRWFEHPNGTGPLKLQTWERDSRIVLARNDAYYKDPAVLSRVEYYLGAGLGDVEL